MKTKTGFCWCSRKEQSVLGCNKYTPTLVHTMRLGIGYLRLGISGGCFPAKNFPNGEKRVRFRSLYVFNNTVTCIVIRIVRKWNWYSEITDYLEILETWSIPLVVINYHPSLTFTFFSDKDGILLYSHCLPYWPLCSYPWYTKSSALSISKIIHFQLTSWPGMLITLWLCSLIPS